MRKLPSENGFWQQTLEIQEEILVVVAEKIKTADIEKSEPGDLPATHVSTVVSKAGPERIEGKNSAAQVNRSLMESLKHAGAGLKRVFIEERNFRIQLFCTLAVVIVGILLKIDRGEWLVVVLLCILVLILEMVNTAIEAIVDMTVGRQFHECAQKAKDVAAGAVVIAAIAALVNGVIIFLPAVINLIKTWS